MMVTRQVNPWVHFSIYIDPSLWEKDCPSEARLFIFKATHRSNEIYEFYYIIRFEDIFKPSLSY